MKKIVFFDPNLNERGTSIATYDYAHFNETYLGNQSIIVSLSNSKLKSYEKFNNRFKTIILDSFSEVGKISCDIFTL